MTLTRLSLSNTVAVAVAVLLVVLFGALSLGRLPVQLTPEVNSPEITITTTWRAAAPEEVEADIIEPQEDALRGLPGATKILAQAQRGRGKITLTFAVGTDLRRALLEVLNRLNKVPSYPEDADEPVISAVGGNSRAIAWFILKPLPGNERDIASYQDFVEEVVQSRFERVPGVALSEVRGGREKELRITFDPYKAAALGVELPEVVQLAGVQDTSGGFAEVGKRRYTIRYTGAYGVDDLADMVIDWRQGRPILLRDVAEVAVELQDRSGFVIQNGEPAMAVNAHRETGVNVLEVMQGLREAVAELRAGPLSKAGLQMYQVYDETNYIYDSIDMVQWNLALGVALAVGILWWFLRKLRATLMVALAIPVCLLGSFVLLDSAGRTLNVISLAGLAFAVGMVLDAAIVVLENIVRLREEGEDGHQASLSGATQVWGALLASTATTVAIFLPVVFLQDEAGQLFADLALTIACAVVFSLIVAVTVIPAAAMSWLRRARLEDPHSRWWDSITRLIATLTDTPVRRSLWIIVLLTVPVAVTWWLKPPANYLPEGNRNLVFTFINAPPGHNIDAIEKEMGQVIAKTMQPHLDGKAEPRVKDYFFVAFPNGVFMGARTVERENTGALVPLINQVVRGFPDTIGFAFRASLFGGFGEGHTIDMNLQGRDVAALLQAGGAAFGMIREAVPGASVRPFPGLAMDEPELRLIPNERRIAEAGWDRGSLAGIVRAFGDGLFVGDYFDGEQRLDIILRARHWDYPEELAAFPLATPDAGVLPFGELVTVQQTAGPAELRRLDRRRTVTLQVRPPADMPLEVALQTLREEVRPKLAPLLPEDATVSFSGTADKLETALKNMGGTFALAVVILFLLMAALFRSFRDSLLVVLALPLATVGGMAALKLVNLVIFQPMDLLTMIGFVILLGLVVNNAILLVYQTRSSEREGISRRDAVSRAVRLRLRPILMSTLTSLFGMLPLLLNPGAGTELYRGLAAVIVGGMSVSMIFTLILLPSLLRLGEGRRQAA
ncbi:MAG TPA: efflux RND transporter permease subunit [Gammaproteobacteria bacterium]|nr:efflux RND transporter permease subunit [Gammaproteobacteria bacterium]